MPFEIPESWVWTTLGKISNYGQCENVNVDDIDDGEWILELEDIEKDTGHVLQKLLKTDRKVCGTRHKFYPNEILYSKLRTYLNKVLVAPSPGFCTLEIIPINCFGVNPHYLCMVLRSNYYLDYTVSLGYGVKMPRLGTNDALISYIPIPPLCEQNRIVNEVAKWNKIIDNIESERSDLLAIVSQIKSKILDFAISGKLIPQDPNDEPAIELLKRINPSFEPCDNSHYEKLPNGWCVCLLKDVFEIIMGQSPDGDSINCENGVEFHQGKICFTNEYLLPSGVYTSKPTKIAEANSLLLCVRAPVGILNITKRKICIGRGLCSLKPKYEINNKYWFYILSAYKDYFEQNATGSTFKAISGDTIKNTEILLPPINEQIRITKAISSLWNILDRITAELQ